MTELSDLELLNRIANGEESAFTIMYNRYWQNVYLLAYKHLQSAESAEEVVQEVFMSIWKKRSSAAKVLHLKSYLAGITRFEVYRIWAGNKKAAIKSRSAAAISPTLFNQEHVIENKLLLECIEKLANRLPEKCRLVFIYNKLLDLPLPEVATILNISPKTAETHLTKALKFMRKQLNNYPLLLLLL